MSTDLEDHRWLPMNQFCGSLLIEWPLLSLEWWNGNFSSDQKAACAGPSWMTAAKSC